MKVSYICSLCFLQLIADATLTIMTGDVKKSMEGNMFKQIEKLMINKDRIYNMIFRDLCAQDEIGATLKLCILTEVFLQNDTFKLLNKA